MVISFMHKNNSAIPLNSNSFTDRNLKHRNPELRVNRRIRVYEVRVIGDDGEQLGVMQTADAILKAEEMGLDLVEVSPTAKPPVCKIMDYGKFKYQQKRKANETKKKQKQQTCILKELKFRPKTDVHDFDTKIKKLKGFLADGNKGRIIVAFKGREMAHAQIGFEILKRIADGLRDQIIIDVAPKLEGRQLVMIVGPIKKK